MTSIETPFGTLVATPVEDEEYPAIYIFLKRENRATLLSVVEKDGEELKLRAYLHAEDDEPSISVAFTDLDAALENYGYERNLEGETHES